MSWTIKYKPDTSIDGEGTVTATQGNTSHSKRIDTKDTKAVEDFCMEAKELYTKMNQDKTNIESIESEILTEINK